MLSLVIATIIYALLTFMMMAAIPGEWWIDADTGKVVEDPITRFAEALAGTEFGIIAAVLSVLTMISMALAGILASSRFLFAMARDNLLPQPLEEVNARFETPHIPIILTGLAMGLAILFVPLKDVVKLASGFKIMIFMIINSCVIVLRQTSDQHDWNPAYKGPLYPYMNIWGIVAGAFLISLMGSKAFLEALSLSLPELQHTISMDVSITSPKTRHSKPSVSNSGNQLKPNMTGELLPSMRRIMAQRITSLCVSSKMHSKRLASSIPRMIRGPFSTKQTKTVMA